MVDKLLIQNDLTVKNQAKSVINLQGLEKSCSIESLYRSRYRFFNSRWFIVNSCKAKRANF